MSSTGHEDTATPSSALTSSFEDVSVAGPSPREVPCGRITDSVESLSGGGGEGETLCETETECEPTSSYSRCHLSRLPIELLLEIAFFVPTFLISLFQLDRACRASYKLLEFEICTGLRNKSSLAELWMTHLCAKYKVPRPVLVADGLPFRERRHPENVFVRANSTEQILVAQMFERYLPNISICPTLSLEVMVRFPELVDWWDVSNHHKISVELLDRFAESLDWRRIGKRLGELAETLSVEAAIPTVLTQAEAEAEDRGLTRVEVLWTRVLKRHRRRFDMYQVCEDLHVPFRSLLELPREDLKGRVISERSDLPLDLLGDLQDLVNWPMISLYQPLTPDLMRRFKDQLHWYNVSQRLELFCVGEVVSVELLTEFAPYLNWNFVVQHEYFEEDLVRRFIDFLPSRSWFWISQKRLSEKFMRDFQDKVFWHVVAERDDLSEEFREEFRDRLIRY